MLVCQSVPWEPGHTPVLPGLNIFKYPLIAFYSQAATQTTPLFALYTRLEDLKCFLPLHLQNLKRQLDCADRDEQVSNRCQFSLNEQQSGDSWMYPYQRTPMGKFLYKPYSSWVFMGFFIPKNPKVEHNIYHGYIVRGTPNLSFETRWGVLRTNQSTNFKTFNRRSFESPSRKKLLKNRCVDLCLDVPRS